MAERTALEYRSHLVALAGEPDPYPFLSLAERYLLIAPQDTQMRATALSLLIRKGLHSVAIELTETCPADSPEAAELGKAIASLRQMQTEVIPLEATYERFEKNLRALAQSPHNSTDLISELKPAWELLASSLSLHRANDGNVLARADLPAIGRTWVPAALDFANKLESLVNPESWKGSFLPPFLLENVGTGLLAPRVHAASQHTYLTHSPPLFVVEPDLRALALALHLQDWSELLTDERTFLLAGPDAWEKWFELMRERAELGEPQQVVTLPPWSNRPASVGEATMERVRRHRESLVLQQTSRVRALYGERDGAYWAQRFAHSTIPTKDGLGYKIDTIRTPPAPPCKGEPLRILGVTSRFTTFLQHSTRDLLDAFDRAGCRTLMLTEEKDYGRIPAHGYMQAIADFRPDLVVVLDHHRHEYGNRFPTEVPFLCWIQDELVHLLQPEVGQQLGPLDFTIGFGRERCVLHYGYPAERFMPCKLAINPAKFRPEPSGAADPALSCDIAYVSHHSEPAEALHARIRELIESPERRRFVDAFFEETRPLMTSGGFNAAFDLDLMLSEVEQKVGIAWGSGEEREKLMTVYIRPLVDRTIRHTTLSWAARWARETGRTLHLYGRGWEQHPEFAPYSRGTAGHGTHLARIANQAAINLHMGLNPALHQRVLETVCAGGFLLARYCPFDFHEPAVDILFDFLREKGITRPTRLRLDGLPEPYVAARRRTASRTNRPVGEYVEITPEDLLQRTGRSADRRYEYASLAFSGFDRITFDSADCFADRAEHFVTRREERQEIVARMARVVEELFTYDALVARITTFLASRLEQMAPLPESTEPLSV